MGRFGASADIHGGFALVGAYYTSEKAAYFYKGLDPSEGVVKTESIRLVPKEHSPATYFGWELAMSGDTAIIGASFANVAYVYRGLDSFAGSEKTDDFRLTINGDTANNLLLGSSIAISGDTAAVGGSSVDKGGTVYVYRGLSTFAGSEKTEDFRLTVSGGLQQYAQFGDSVAMSGDSAIVALRNSSANSGIAYVYHGLDTFTGSEKTEDIMLTVAGGTQDETYTRAVSMSKGIAVIGEYKTSDYGGIAYVYRGLDTFTGSEKTEDVRLTIVGGTSQFTFLGESVAVSEGTAIVGGLGNGAYIYLDVGDASKDGSDGTRTEDVKVLPFHPPGESPRRFAESVAMDGDNFVVGYTHGGLGDLGDIGLALTGSVSSMTTLDSGDTTRTIHGLSFESQVDWIVGKHTSGNKVVLGANDTATVMALGKAVYIGKEADSNGNTLQIEGILIAEMVYIGSVEGNSGNQLRLMEGSFNEVAEFKLACGNELAFEWGWDSGDTAELFIRLDGTVLSIWDDGGWVALDEENYLDYLESGYLVITETAMGGMLVLLDCTVIPEPSTWLLLCAGAAFAAITYSRRRNGHLSKPRYSI